MYQIYKAIEDSGTKGVSQGDLFHKNIGAMGRKELLRRIDSLVEHYGVVRVADVTEISASKKRTMTYRLVTEESYKQLQKEGTVPDAAAAAVPSTTATATVTAETGEQQSQSAPSSHQENEAAASQGSASGAATTPTPQATTLSAVMKRKRPMTTLEKKRTDALLAHLEKEKVPLEAELV